MEGQSHDSLLELEFTEEKIASLNKKRVAPKHNIEEKSEIAVLKKLKSKSTIEFKILLEVDLKKNNKGEQEQNFRKKIQKEFPEQAKNEEEEKMILD